MESPITFLAFTKHICLWKFLGVGHVKLHFHPHFPHTSNIPDGQGIHNLVANSTFILLKAEQIMGQFFGCLQVSASCLDCHWGWTLGWIKIFHPVSWWMGWVVRQVWCLAVNVSEKNIIPLFKNKFLTVKTVSRKIRTEGGQSQKFYPPSFP